MRSCFDLFECASFQVLLSANAITWASQIRMDFTAFWVGFTLLLPALGLFSPSTLIFGSSYPKRVPYRMDLASRDMSSEKTWGHKCPGLLLKCSHLELPLPRGPSSEPFSGNC